MTLYDLIDKISEYAVGRQLIEYSAGGTSIMEIDRAEGYPLLFVAPTGNHRVSQNTTTFTITLYYIDRLLDDSTNNVTLFSNSINALKDLVLGIATLDGVTDVSEDFDIANFTETEKLNDKVAGAYTTIQVTTLNDYTCPIE